MENKPGQANLKSALIIFACLIIGIVLIVLFITMAKGPAQEQASKDNTAPVHLFSDTDTSSQQGDEDTSDQSTLEDSVKKVQIGDEEQYAYGKLKFGASRDEVKRLLPLNEYVALGKYNYMFYPIFDQNGQLYRLIIVSDYLTSDYYSTIKDEIINLDNIIGKKYETYLTEDNDIQEYYKTSYDYIALNKKWTIGDKIIATGLAKDHDGRYAATCILYSQRLSDAFEQESNAEEDTAQTNAASNF